MARVSKSSDNSTILVAALEGLELQKQRIESQIQQVRKLLGYSGDGADPALKRRLSPAARKRIAAAQKRRWAAYRKNAAEQ